MEQLPNRAKNIAGQIRGRLTVEKYTGKDRAGACLWLCRCECGNFVIRSSIYLSLRIDHSCGCLRGAAALLRHSKSRNDIIGQKFGKLVVTGFHQIENKRSYYNCSCDCGNSALVSGSLLKNGSTRSCGCLALEVRTKHGLHQHKLHDIWTAMKHRCYNQNNSKYDRYGGRGIQVCDLWRYNFGEFYYWAVANGYQENLTIERRNNDGNYEPGNCKWASRIEQARNKSSTKLSQEDVVAIRSDTRSASHIAQQYGVSVDHIRGIKARESWKDI